MLDGIEALIALERCGTVSEAALSLRLTQSAVTKRIQALQTEVGFPLTEPDGRRVRLTPEARNYIERARPLILELKGLTREKSQSKQRSFSLAMADSIASSWGPQLVKSISNVKWGFDFQLHAHRSALVIEAVRLGRYQLGLCTAPAKLYDLVSEPVISEPMVLMFAGLNKKLDLKLPIITIETGSATWAALAKQVGNISELKSREFIRVESFSAAYQMTAAGYGNGLLPLGLVKTMRASAKTYDVMPDLTREISLITRKTIAEQDSFQALTKTLREKSQSVLNR